jgi:iron complex transport system permease protein
VSTPRKTVAKPGGGAGTTPKARTTASRSGPGPAGKAKGAKAGAGVPPPPGPGLVVGTVPALARVAGAVAVAGAVVLLIAPGFPLANSGDVELGGPGNAWAFVPALPLVLAVAAGGVLAARGRLPRLGLAVLFPAGTIAAGLLVQAAVLLRTGSHSTLDLPLGIGTSSRYEAGAGLVLAVLGYALLVAAALVAAAAWPRTIMEDAGELDPRRPRLAAWGLAAGVLTALVLGMAPYSSSIAPGTPTLPERHGLDLLGAAIVALGAAAWAVLAATLRPRLAVVGAYAGLAATLLTIGLGTGLLVVRSDALGTSAGGIGVLLAALAAAVLALVAGRVGRATVTA